MGCWGLEEVVAVPCCGERAGDGGGGGRREEAATSHRLNCEELSYTHATLLTYLRFLLRHDDLQRVHGDVSDQRSQI